jgi:hypothetical protein
MESGETLLNNHWLGNGGGSLSFLVGTISNKSQFKNDIGFCNIVNKQKQCYFILNLFW